MANWHTIPKHKRPLGWYACKVLCDIGWLMRHWIGYGMYHRWLDYMCERYQINYYGQRMI
jgi:hypothetical protein